MLVYDIYIRYIMYANSFSACCKRIPFAISVHCRTSRQLNQSLHTLSHTHTHSHIHTANAFSFIFAVLFQTDLITIRAAVRNAISELWHNFYAQTRCSIDCTLSISPFTGIYCSIQERKVQRLATLCRL